MVAIGSFCMPRCGNYSHKHDRSQNEILEKCIRDFSLKSLAITLNGKFTLSDKPFSEALDSKLLRRLHHVCKDLTLDQV